MARLTRLTPERRALRKGSDRNRVILIRFLATATHPGGGTRRLSRIELPPEEVSFSGRRWPEFRRRV